MNTVATREEMRSPLVCPKPRRIGQIAGASDPILPLRWQFSHHVESCDVKAGVELLDNFFITKVEEQSNSDTISSFFCGSPPSRSGNPLVHDDRFGEVTPVTYLMNSPNPNPISIPNPMSFGSPVSGSASTSARKGCARAKFGFAPAAVRVEGFDCSRTTRGIPAFA